MLVECIREFKDMAAGVMRHAGEHFEADEERFAALNATRYGQLVKAVEEKAVEPQAEPQPEPKAAKPKGARMTKAELLDKAEALGIDVPKGATNREIADLIAGE